MKNTDSFCFWDIILAEYDFSDGSGSKLRPVFVLFREREDYTVLKMTSQSVTGWDILVFEPDIWNGLKIKTSIRMQKINTFHETLFVKKIWQVTDDDKKKIKEFLIRFIKNL